MATGGYGHWELFRQEVRPEWRTVARNYINSEYEAI